MNNQIYRVHGSPSVLHRSQRKLIWFSLPELTPIYKYYTRSTYISSMSSGSIMVIDGSSIIFLTVQLPPLTLSEFRRDFLEWKPIGGFCLAMMLVLHDKHSITFYDRGTTLKKNWVIEVIQEIKEIKHSLEQLVIGMMVKQKLNTIFIWKIGVVSSKPFQQVEVSQPIVKWEFYAEQMLIIVTKTDIQIFSPNQDQYYNMNFFTELQQTPLDFCVLDRPKTVSHSGRRSVHTVGIITATHKLQIYQLYDIEKRIKNSTAKLSVSIDINSNIGKILCGYEEKNHLILCFESVSGKPISYTLNNKFEVKSYKQFSPDLSCSPSQIQYRKQIICVSKQTEENHVNNKLYHLKNCQQFEQIETIKCEICSILGNYGLYCFNQDNITVFNKEKHSQQNKIIDGQIGKINKNQHYCFNHQSKIVITLQNPNPKLLKSLKILQQIKENGWVYFLAGIKVYKLDIKEKTFKAVGFTVKNQRFKLKQIRTHTRSIVYNFGGDNVLMEYKIDPENGKLSASNIRTTKNEIISLRNGRWAEKFFDKIVVGYLQNNLVSFDLAKFFKALTQDNILFDYQIYWTTHDGIILLVKNYYFILQLVESSDGYTLSPLKKMLTYLHHRFNPDIMDLQVLDPRQNVVREGNRIIKLGSKLGSFVSEDPFALPDTVLNRQLAMRKHYPPHHPKLVNFLLQMGFFTHLVKMVKQIHSWLEKGDNIQHLFDKIGCKFYQAYCQEQDERIVSSIEGEEQEIDIIKSLCEKILEEPHQLCLQQNGSLILQSQFESLIFKDQNSRSLDYYSAIVLTQFRTYEYKHKKFDMMHVAYMLHSINKQQAITILRQSQEEISWNWMQRFSIVMWYDGKEQLKKWIEEIGTNQFKKNKEPMDCMLWYMLVGKKNVLATLFKKYQFNSKQHQAIFKFLQRDFNDPKQKMAASKNAFKLLDSKRYFLSIAFFLMGENYSDAISICLTRLKDLNLALLILILTANDKKQIIDLLLKEGDIWGRHVGYFYKSQHIDSFNCLFDPDELEKIEEWGKQPQLVGFHPCIQQFAQMMEKSIPVKRQLEEQKISQNQSSNDIFQSFYGNDSPQDQMQEKQIKQLNPNYSLIKNLSCQYFLKNNCPLLSLMIDNNNRKAQRANDLCNFMLTKKITPNVIEIAEQMQDILGILSSKISYGLPIKSTLQNFGCKMIEAINDLGISVMFQLDRTKVGKLMHYCYFAQQIFKLCAYKFIEDQSLKQIKSDLEIMRLVGKIFLILQLDAYEIMEQNISTLIRYLGKEIRVSQSQEEQQRNETWKMLKQLYGQQLQIKKNKSHQIMDLFEQTFYKYTFQKSESQFQNTNIFIQIYQSRSPAIKREYIRMMASLLEQQKIAKNSQIGSQLVGKLNQIKGVLDQTFTYWVDKQAKDQLEKQVGIMYAQGAVSKLKINFLNEFLSESYDGVCRSLGSLHKLTIKKMNNQEGPKIRDLVEHKKKMRVEVSGQKQAIQIFRSKADPPRAFAINMNSGQGMDLVFLQKKNLRKLDICQSLINRNRSQDGLSLIHDDTLQGIDTNIDYEKILESSYPPLLAQHLTKIIQNRNEFDGRGIIQGSTKRGSDDYLKQLDTLPYIDNGDISSLACHHFLPIYMAGSKASIELFHFDNLKNYNRIKCPGMSDIIKTISFDQRVTGLDNSGNLGIFTFDAKISGNCVFSMKKAGVVDFCMMKPTILGICTSNSIQVIDTLLHPKRQCVFKYQTSQTPLAIDSYQQDKIVVARKTDLVVFDIRMNEQVDNRDLGGKFRCMQSNHKDKILIGRTDNRVKIIDMNSGDSDQQLGLGRQSQDNEKINVESLKLMGKCALALNSEGSIYLMDSY